MSFASVIYKIIATKWWAEMDDPKPSFEGQTAMVTGANVGLGLEAAYKIAALGPSRLILAVRTVSKGEAAKRDIESRLAALGPAHKLPLPAVEVWELDMASYDSIRSFATRCTTTLPALDVAILNAGIVKRHSHTSTYGFEETLQINTLSTTLLALLLIPILRKSKTASHTPVLEIVASSAHLRYKLPSRLRATDANIIDAASGIALDDPAKYAGNPQYALSKLLIMCVSQQLALQLDRPQSADANSRDVHVVPVCPGPVMTTIARDWTSNPLIALLLRIMTLLVIKSPEQGARTYLKGVEDAEELHGKFLLINWEPEVGFELRGEEGRKLRERVWHDVLVALGRDVPEIGELAKL